MTQQDYQLLPSLSDEEYQALKADIAKHGVLVPVEIDEVGAILDGHHRVQIWHELRSEGVKVPDYERLVRIGMTEEQKRNHVRALNLCRRHLSKDQLREQMKAMRQDGATLEEIAKATGVDTSTVLRQTAEIANANSEITNIRGQKRPAKYAPRKPKTVLATTAKEEQRALDVAQNAADALPEKTITVKRGERIQRESTPTVIEDAPTVQAVDDISLRLADFRQVMAELEDESIDLIFTDPPYPAEYLSLWSDLAELASRKLKPGGLLVAYSGQYHLPKVMSALGEHLEYIWLGALVTPGQHNQVQQKHVRSGVKPLLFYARAPYQPGVWFDDVYVSEERAKEDHEWQQSIGAAMHYIERLTKPGDFVFEPFLGSGTTPKAARELGRRCVACDVDPVAFETATRRVIA